ncbi:MAG: helix-turn-helix transcriptional regulator [Actinobacteria bacterium]|nr:MAG: helix-turn-helix transcriptional regulator [Actinomycetota bacterium]
MVANPGSIAQTLIDARKAAGLSQATLAERMSTTQPAISKVESGRAVPTLGFLERFAKAIGAPVTVTLEPGASVHADTRAARLAARPALLEDLYVDLLREAPDVGAGTSPAFRAARVIATGLKQDLDTRPVRRAIAEVRRSDRQAGARLSRLDSLARRRPR